MSRPSKAFLLGFLAFFACGWISGPQGSASGGSFTGGAGSPIDSLVLDVANGDVHLSRGAASELILDGDGSATTDAVLAVASIAPMTSGGTLVLRSENGGARLTINNTSIGVSTGFSMEGNTIFGNSVTVSAHTEGSGAPHALTTTLDLSRVFTNEGTTVENHQDLPSAVAGDRYIFVVQDADGMQINAASGDTIRIDGTVSASGGFVSSTTIGDVLVLVAINATEWVAVGGAGLGNWTFDT